jgi:hypothetical protein
MAAPSFRAAATASGASGTSVTVNKPSGTAENDVLIALVYIEDHIGSSITPPSGWTQLRRSDQSGPPPFDYSHVTYWKRAGASEPGSYQWSWTGTKYREAFIIAVQGCATSGDPIDVEAATVNGAQDDAPVAPSVTTTVADTLLLCIYTSADGGNAVWAPGSSGLTERVDSVSMAAYDVAVASAGATGSKTVSCTGGINPEWHVGAAIALKPPAGTPVSQTIVAPGEALATAARALPGPFEALGAPIAARIAPAEALTTPAATRAAPVEATFALARSAAAPWEALARASGSALLPWEATSPFTIPPGVLALAAEYAPLLALSAEYAPVLDLSAEHDPIIDLEAQL